MRNNSSSLASYPDDELVLQAQARNPEAFEELMRRTNRSAFKLALSILRDRQEAEDEVQNSYLKAWSYVGQFQRESKFSTWISRIVVNQCLMRIRKFRGASFVYLGRQLVKVSVVTHARFANVQDRPATGVLSSRHGPVIVR